MTKTPITTIRTRYMTETSRRSHGQHYLYVDLNADSAADGGLGVQWVPMNNGYRKDGAVHLIALEDFGSESSLNLSYPVNPDALEAWLESPEAEALWKAAETTWRYSETTEYPQYQQGIYMPEEPNAEVAALFNAIDAIAAAVVALPDLGEHSGAWDAWDWFDGCQNEILACLTEENLEELAKEYLAIAASQDVKLSYKQIEIYLTQLLSWK